MCDGSSATEDTAAACGDGCDNDGNGFADCNEFDCCSVRSDCGPTTACGRDAGRPRPCDTMGDENTAAACGDGCDNDGNGFADCNDFDCCGLVACDPGTECEGSLPPCPTMGPETTAAACADMCDNDHNGFGDCNEFDCCDVVSCPAGTACGGDGGSMVAPRCDGAMMMENSAMTCGDGCDNDGNGFADCEDFDCCSVRSDCPASSACGMPRPDGGPRPMRCMGAPTPENTLMACSNGCSDDDDTFVDCEERDCCTVRVDCPADTYCGIQCPGPALPDENTLVLCSDGCSNDADPYADCEDRGCCAVRGDCPAGTECGDM
jgi:hypothetical protein